MDVMNAAAFTCRRCLIRSLPSRPYRSSRSFANARERPPPASGFAKLSSRRLISVTGDDATKYLQGLIAANLSRSSAGSRTALYSVFLNAQGRVLYDVFIYPAQTDGLDNGLLVEVDANEVDALYKHLKRYKLRAKIGLRIVDRGEVNVWSAWGQQDTIRGNAVCDERVPKREGHPDMGSRILLAESQKLEIEGEEVEQDTYDLRRIGLGVPEGQGDILKETALPQESNIDYMRGVDFRKGCYVGQELTIRTHHTGVVRKRILPVQLYPSRDEIPTAISYDSTSVEQLPPSGSNLSRVDKKGRSAGKWLGGVGNIGLALCRLEVMTDTVLTGEGSQWSPENEFKMSWKDGPTNQDQEIQVKAFVPWWHAVRGQEQGVHRSVE